MKTKHVHAELIKAWADGAQIEHKGSEGWNAIRHPNWLKCEEYRVKPELEYPKSRLTDEELESAYDSCKTLNWIDALRCIADEAIKRYSPFP